MSEALRLADAFENAHGRNEVSTELRRLHALNDELAKALRETTGAHELGVLLSVRGLDKARAALAKVEASNA